jgi:hypothetical protein
MTLLLTREQAVRYLPGVAVNRASATYRGEGKTDLLTELPAGFSGWSVRLLAAMASSTAVVRNVRLCGVGGGHGGNEMGTGPLDGLRVLDLIGFMVVELAVAVVSASRSLLAEAGRQLIDATALPGSLWTVYQPIADDSPPADRGQREATGCPPW